MSSDNMLVDSGIPAMCEDAAPTEATQRPEATGAPISRRTRSRRNNASQDGQPSASASALTEEPSSLGPMPKRRRTTKSKEAPNETANQKTAHRRKSSKLSELPLMPLDILLEIFRQLGPGDLVKLSRINKDFRHLLLNRPTSLSVWKDALQSVEGLPKCPRGMFEPAWANLVFSPYCHFCLTRTPNIEWLFRVRICQKCSNEYLQHISPYLSLPTLGAHVNNVSLISLIPNRRGRRGIRLCLRSEYMRVEEEYHRLQTLEEQKAYVQRRREIVDEIQDHSVQCQQWERMQTQNRSDEIYQLKVERKAAIVKKLEELGLGDEVKQIRSPDSLANHKFVNRPQRLTDKIWSHIKKDILEFMEKMKAKRLEREYKDLKLIRKGLAITAVRIFKKANHPESHYFPEPADYCKFPAIQAIIEEPANATVEVSSFADVVQSFPNLIADWRRGVDEKLKEVLKRGEPPAVTFSDLFGGIYYDEDIDEDYGITRPTRTPKAIMSDEGATAKLNLAATVFECKKCDPNDDDDDCCLFAGDYWSPVPRAPSRPLFYPQVIGHLLCLTRGPGPFSWEVYPMETETHDPSIFLTHSAGFGKERRPWFGGYLQFNKYKSTKAEAVVKAAGLDPAVATTEDMDGLKLRFICKICSEEKKKEQNENDNEGCSTKPIEPVKVAVALYEWRAMVRHLSDKHFNETSLITMRVDELGEDVTNAEEALRMKIIPQWACMHCLDTIDERGLCQLPVLKRHLNDKHKITSVTLNEDYFEHFTSPDIRAYHQPLWVYWTDGKVALIPPAAKNEGDDKDASNQDHDLYAGPYPLSADIDSYAPNI